MSLNNVIKVEAAGAGKTYQVCSEALGVVSNKDNKKKVLIMTYTNRGVDSIKSEIKKQNSGVLSPDICIMSWYRFLLNEMIKPFQTELFGVNEIKSIDFDDRKVRINYNKAGTRKRYINKNRDLYAREMGELALRLNNMKNGGVVKRIQDIFSHIFIDEIQDMAGYDLNIIEILMESDASIVCVGDNKQATFKTNNSNKNKKISGSNIWEFFSYLENNGKAIIKKNLKSRRFNEEICNFSNLVYSNENNISTSMNEVTDHDGVFLIRDKDIKDYYNFYNPQVLKYDVRTDVRDYSSFNFGECKGMTFDRVLIYPNGPLKNFIMKQKTLSSPQKYYVAVTRAKYSVAFVVDKFPNDSEWFKNVKIEINGKEIEAMKYIS